MRRRHSVITLAVLTLVVSCSVAGCGQQGGGQKIDYPNKPITIIVPTAAGGGYDLGARAVARFLPKHLPKQVDVVVQNMPGAGQMIGVHAVYAAKPDGYTLGAFNAIGAVMSQYGRPEPVQFDVSKFLYLGMWQDDVRALGVSKNVQAKTWDELIALSKKKPLRCGTGGAGSSQHIDPFIIDAASEVDFEYIHYEGSAGVNPAMGRGEIDTTVAQVGTIMELVEAGLGRNFCVFDTKRHPGSPDTPTAIEAGMPRAQFDKLTNSPFFGVNRVLAAPPGIDPAIVAILRKAMWETFQDPEYQAEVKKAKGENNPMKGEDYQKVMEAKVKAAIEDKQLTESLKAMFRK
ncbi:MAG: tripartite tricarboxylate transporter substrate binding protein [Firmicutes bacterium]|nr:tripartite tricarboxylate transporter substrate binding protein [Bacillota bacterium]